MRTIWAKSVQATENMPEHRVEDQMAAPMRIRPPGRSPARDHVEDEPEGDHLRRDHPR